MQCLLFVKLYVLLKNIQKKFNVLRFLIHIYQQKRFYEIHYCININAVYLCFQWYLYNLIKNYMCHHGLIYKNI